MSKLAECPDWCDLNHDDPDTDVTRLRSGVTADGDVVPVVGRYHFKQISPEVIGFQAVDTVTGVPLHLPMLGIDPDTLMETVDRANSTRDAEPVLELAVALARAVTWFEERKAESLDNLGVEGDDR